MLRVSFSPAPECVVADCWNRIFPTPSVHQGTVCFVLYHSYSILLFGYFLKPDYHYTTISGFCKSEKRNIGTKIIVRNKMVQYLRFFRSGYGIRKLSTRRVDCRWN